MTEDRELISDINQAVNRLVRRLPGITWGTDPGVTLARKSGSSGDMARAKLHILASKGVCPSRLLLATDYKGGKSLALVKSSYSPFWVFGKRPCLLVLDCETDRIYRLMQTKYSRRSNHLAVTPYVRAILQPSLSQ